MTKLTRFAVAPLHAMTRRLADVASARVAPDLVISGARVLSTYSERIHANREVWITGGRIAAVKPAGAAKRFLGNVPLYDAAGGIIAPGLVDPHIHIESSMVTACAYAEAALLNGTTTIFCDSHEIGNVMDVAGVEAMLEDAREAPLSIFPDGAEHGTGHFGRTGDCGRRSHAGQDRRPVRPLAGSSRARREDGFCACYHGR
ncbi:adenine deaminase [Bradyrhizobium sp. LB7.2]